MTIISWFWPHLDVQTVVLLISITFFFYQIQRLRYVHLPSGPWGLPIVGYLPFMLREQPFKVLNKIAHSHGNVFSVQLGNRTVICFNDYHSIKQGFASTDACSFRASLEMFNDIIPNRPKKLFFVEGECAKQQRRFIMMILKESGIAKPTLESKLLEEIKHLTDAIKSINGKPTDLWNLLVASNTNILWRLVFGQRFEYTDKLLQRILRETEKIMQKRGLLNFKFFFPWIAHVPIFNHLIRCDESKASSFALYEVILERIRHRKLTHVIGDRNDYVDAFLTEQANQIQKFGTAGFFEIQQLLGNLTAIFGIGTETIASTLHWSILYLIKYPKIYQKIEQEIQKVLGMDREPSLSDKPNMPYIEAFLMETLRSNPALPLGIFHSNVEKITVGGEPIPVNSLIIGNIWAVHHDPKIWGDPDIFRPERFIDENGQIKISEYLIPFSIGTRSCLVENLAQMELFLTFTSLCQRFRFELEDGKSPCFDGDFGIIYKPKPHKIRAIAK